MDARAGCAKLNISLEPIVAIVAGLFYRCILSNWHLLERLLPRLFKFSCHVRAC